MRTIVRMALALAGAASLGFDVRPNTAAEFAAFVREEVPEWAKAVKDSGAKAD